MMPRTRSSLILASVATLACAGLLGPPKLVTRALKPFTIDTVEGDDAGNTDYGGSGQVNSESRGVTQALSWDVQDDDDAEQKAGALWRGMRGIFASMSPNSTLPEQIALTHSLVDGQDAVSFESDIGAEWITGTVFICPASATTVTLSSTSLKGLAARETHQRSLASVRCGSQPVKVDASIVNWTFTGDPSWLEREGGTVEHRTWWRADQQVEIDVSSQSASFDGDVPHLCTEILRQSHEALRPSYTFDESQSRYDEKADSCTHTFAATQSDGSPVRGRIEHHDCDKKRAFMAICLLFDTTDSLDVCLGHVRCQ